MITVMVNGETRQLPAPELLPEFLKTLGMRTDFMAVAYNGEVLRKEQHSEITLEDGDVLELVRPVGGGALRLPVLSRAEGPKDSQADS